MDSINISFSPTDPISYISYFKENGYVVVQNILTPEEIQNTIDQLWSSPNLLKSTPKVDPKDPTTWENDTWPVPGGEGRESKGFFNSLNLFEDIWAWKNRQNQNVFEVFKNILERDQLWVVTDRYGIMRPTRNILLQDGTLVDKPHWRTASSWLHWDQNPWREPDFVRVQGLLALTDHTLTSGGFCCVPGFNHRFKGWGVSNPLETVPGAAWGHTLVSVPEGDPIQGEKRAILMKAGSLLVWDSRLPHQNYPNEDNTWRIVQYVTFQPVDPTQSKTKKNELIQKIKSGLTGTSFPSFLTEIGRKISGLDLWEGDDDDDGDEKIFEPPKLSPEHKEALECLKKAQEFEVDGDYMSAVKWYKQAYRLNPVLETYGAYV